MGLGWIGLVWVDDFGGEGGQATYKKGPKYKYLWALIVPNTFIFHMA